jgi:hypothetical protein
MESLIMSSIAEHFNMRFPARLVLPILFCLASAPAQVTGLTDASVSGNFFFRHVQLTSDTLGNISNTSCALGTMTFDGAGHYNLNAVQTVGNQNATTLTGQGSYSVASGGLMTLGNPQRNNFTINARIGTEAIVGSTTESGDNTFDFFIAVPAATPAQAAASFSGTYYVTTLEFPLSVQTNVKSANFTLAPEGNGLFAPIVGVGHALNVSAGQISNFTIASSGYVLQNDGTAQANFGSLSNYLNGAKDILISASGNIILGGSILAGAQDLLIGVKAFSGTPSVSNLTGLYFTGGLRYDALNKITSGYSGSFDAVASLARAGVYQRFHQTSAVYDYTGYQDFTLNSSGTYTAAVFNILGLGVNGGSFVAADVASQADAEGFSIDFGIAADALAGSGPYIHPNGILNGASFAPAGAPIAPGEFVTIFGSGLADAEFATTPPYPTTLGGVGITVNGVSAPIYYVSATQVNFLVPFSATGATAAVVLTNNAKTSNTVTVPSAATAPAVFTLDSSGIGPGAILHSSSNKPVNSASPAKAGETVSIYLTGLGAVSPAVPDGVAGSSKITSNLTVTIGTAKASVTYAGLAPGFPGLYQINLQIPSSLKTTGNIGVLIQAGAAYAEQATIAIQ